MLIAHLHRAGRGADPPPSYAAQYAAPGTASRSWRSRSTTGGRYAAISMPMTRWRNGTLARIAAEDGDQVLRANASATDAGVAAARRVAGLIRLRSRAGGLQHDGELANGLAYWVSALVAAAAG